MVVDIIVPVYNVSKYLNKCIESLLAQTYKYIKIILVDDGSTDGSEKICDNYARIDDRINVIHKENGGLVSAWTMGIKNSKSEWVVFVDGDDWVEYKHIELLVKEQIESSADIVVTRMKQIDKGNEKFIEFCVPEGRYIGEKLKTELHPVMINAGGFERRGVPFSRCSKLIRKSIIIRNLKYSYEKATYDQVVFLISDDSESTEMLVESLGKLGIVYKSILVKTKKLTYQKSMIDKIKDFVEVCFLKKNRYVIFLKEVINEKFDEFIFFNYGVDTVAFYNLMVRNNINLRVSCIEEGILSYKD